MARICLGSHELVEEEYLQLKVCQLLRERSDSCQGDFGRSPTVQSQDSPLEFQPDQTALLALQACIDQVPGWKHVDKKQCSISPLTGGLTNIMYLVKLASDAKVDLGTERAVVVRQFGAGTEAFINRDNEALVYEVFASCGVGPKILGHFKGGRLEQFFPSTRMQCKALRQPENMCKIGGMLGKVHGTDAPNLPGRGKAHGTVIAELRDWAQKAEAISFGDNSTKQDLLANMKVKSLIEEMEVLISALSCLDSKITLCHNDLHEGNLLENNDGSGELKMIDFEYAGWGPRGYDLGNLFCEISVDNFSENELGFKYSPAAYPSKTEQYVFFKEYLLAQGLRAEALELEMSKLYVEANMYALASHMKWTLWGIASAASSDIEFDFLTYAQARLSAYYEWKAAWCREELWPEPHKAMAAKLAGKVMKWKLITLGSVTVGVALMAMLLAKRRSN